MADIVELQDSEAWNLATDLSWDEPTRKLTIHYTGDPTGLSEAISKYLPAGTYNLARDKYSHKVLTDVSHTISLRAQAIKFPLAAIGANSSNSGIDLEYVSSELTPLSSATLAAFKVTVSAITRLPVDFRRIEAGPVSASRLNDNAPFWGGNRMHKQNTTKQCTSGFKVQNSSTSVMLTADHCGDIGDRWYSGNGSSTGNYEGTMADGNSGGSDFMKLTGSTYGAKVWLAENGGENQAVKGSFNAVTGDTVCMDGSFSGQRCNLRITNPAYEMCVFDLGRCYNNEVRFLNDAGNGVVQKGDSGGPSLKGTSGGALVGGVLTGFYPNSQASSCVNGSAGPCYYEGFYAGVRAFLNNNPSWRVSTS